MAAALPLLLPLAGACPNRGDVRVSATAVIRLATRRRIGRSGADLSVTHGKRWRRVCQPTTRAAYAWEPRARTDQIVILFDRVRTCGLELFGIPVPRFSGPRAIHTKPTLAENVRGCASSLPHLAVGPGWTGIVLHRYCPCCSLSMSNRFGNSHQLILMLIRDCCVLRIVAGHKSFGGTQMLSEGIEFNILQIRYSQFDQQPTAIDPFGQARFKDRNPAKVGKRQAVRVHPLANAPMR